jgi:hypothetical protein
MGDDIKEDVKLAIKRMTAVTDEMWENNRPLDMPVQVVGEDLVLVLSELEILTYKKECEVAKLQAVEDSLMSALTRVRGL